jgi:hypothetical protein
VHPRRVLHGPAAPDWRGEIRVGRTSTLTQRLKSNSDCEYRVAHAKVPQGPMILGQTSARHRCAERAKPRTYTGPRLAPPDVRPEIPFWLPVLLPPRLRLLRGVASAAPSSPSPASPSPVVATLPPLALPPPSPPAVAAPRPAPVTVAVAVAAPVVPRRRRSSLHLCRRLISILSYLSYLLSSKKIA